MEMRELYKNLTLGDFETFMRPRTTYKKLFKNLFKKSYTGDWLDFGYYFVSEVMNVYPFARLSRKYLVCPLCDKSNIYFFHLEQIGYQLACSPS